jgi:N-acetylglucosamine kinase-like BadF-type ATPase
VTKGPAAVLAVDGGNSKAELALVDANGRLLSAVRGPTISHQAVGLESGMANLAALASKAAEGAGRHWPAADRAAGVSGRMPRGGKPPGPARRATEPLAELGIFCLAGADHPSDVRLLTKALEGLGLTERTIVLNDTFAALRAGTHRPWGVVLICGQGINGAAVAPDGRSARFDALGMISGDWGGARSVGEAGLAAAVRARDGRGPATTLEQLVPAHFKVRSTSALTRALYVGRIDEDRLTEVCPVVFRAAREGDVVARGILIRLADELVAMAGALIRRLRMTELDPEVVLGGGVFAADDPAFYAWIEAGIQAVAPRATIVRLTAPPVLGAALLGLDRQSPAGSTDPAAVARLRKSIEDWARRRR